MSAKNARQKRKCKGKVHYNSRKDADHARRLSVVKYQPNRAVNVYRCPFCHKWHIGHSRMRIK
jgi:hypothetical protein